MKEKEEVRTQVGIFNLPGNMAFPNDKVLQIFTKLKRKTKETEKITQSLRVFESGQCRPLKELEPNIREINKSF